MLPTWLQDNEYLRSGHRPPLPSFASCFQSIFKLHTETGNIWTHLYGCLAFIGLGAWFLCRPSWQVSWQDKLIFSAFFFGAVCCLGLSFSFHTVQCHSISVGKLFSKYVYFNHFLIFFYLNEILDLIIPVLQLSLLDHLFHGFITVFIVEHYPCQFIFQ